MSVLKNYDKEVSLILEQWSGSVHRSQSHRVFRASPDFLVCQRPAEEENRRLLKKPRGT